MYTITFYSFKGGVGRTMALVNVAAELVRRGRKVLVVDFDLEAPGLTTYKHLRPPKPSPGVVEYVTEFIRTNESPEVSRFVYHVDLTPVLGRLRRRKSGKQVADADAPESTGQLWVMPAGKGDAAYGAALAAIDWNSLYENQHGYLFFEDTKLQWEKSFKPDYVLIDSRTGHTDVGGICTRQLADAVVLMFTPNEQNLVGLENVCRDIRREATEGLKKPIRLHFVAANVPDLDDERGLLRRQLESFRNKLAIHREIPCHPRVVIHRYESLALLEQPIFVQQRPRSRLAREYRRLVQRLVMDNPLDRDGVLVYVRGLERDRFFRDMWPSARIPYVEGRLRQIASQFENDAQILLRLARFHQGRGELDLALRRLDRVLQLQPGWPEALLARGRCRRQVRDNAGASEDLLQYLRSPDFFPKDAMKADAHRLHRLRDAMTALRELIDVSFEAFLQGLASPGARENSYVLSPAGACIWLNNAAEYLLRERLWDEAIRYLETDVSEWTSRLRTTDSAKYEGIMFPYCQGEQLWYLAMANWGKTGSLRLDLSSQAAEHLLQAVEQCSQFGAENCQRLALLHWGMGDANRASAFLDRALEESSNAGLTRYNSFYRGVSNWTFQEASLHEFRQHCEAMRRMFQGEPLRPAFLGPPSPATQV